MKKAWLIIVVSSIFFWGATILFPREEVSGFLFGDTNKNQFEESLNEQRQEALKEQLLVDKSSHTELDSIQNNKKQDSINLDKGGLNHFLAKLLSLDKDGSKQVRIGFFGDSMEDGDMLVMQFRHFLQERFGGEGVGFVPLTSVTAKGRYSIVHRFSNNWGKRSFMKRGKGIFPFGLNGETFFVGNKNNEKTAFTSYQKGSAYTNLPLINPRLFYGKKRKNTSKIKSQVIYSSYKTKKTIALSPKKILNVVALPNNLPNKFKLSITDRKTIPFYGVDFSSNNGVIVDNLATRGNTGLPLNKLDNTLMQQFNEFLDYDLVILAYGTNVYSPKTTKYDWYKKTMLRNIEKIKKCFPSADILIISMGDHSIKINGTMQTPKNLPVFIDLQKQMAQEANTGFYNLYEEMGGNNSMVKWVEVDKLANKDYTHFNPKGADKAGNMLYQWLLGKYSEFSNNN